MYRSPFSGLNVRSLRPPRSLLVSLRSSVLQINWAQITLISLSLFLTLSLSLFLMPLGVEAQVILFSPPAAVYLNSLVAYSSPVWLSVCLPFFFSLSLPFSLARSS